MSVNSIQISSRTAHWKRLLVATMAIVVLSLQFGLPWLSYSLAQAIGHDVEPGSVQGFWKRRFSFDQFLNPHSPEEHLLLFDGSVFAVVCGDEIVVLARPNQQSGRVYRINIRTGRATSSPIPEEIVSVASDGRSLSWINSDSDWGDVIVWEGRPVRFQPCNDGDLGRLKYEMMHLDDGKWHPTNRYVYVPFGATFPRFELDHTTGKLCCFARFKSDHRQYFRYDVPIYSGEDGADAASPAELEGRLTNWNDDTLRAMGWRPLPAFDHFGWSPRWVEGNVISEFKHSDSASSFQTEGRDWIRYFEDGRIERQFVAFPLPERFNDRGDHFGLVTSTEGVMYLYTRSQVDGRWTVLRWDNGRWITLLDQHSPLLAPVCVDAIDFAMFAFVIPMMVLVVLSRVIQGRPTPTNSFPGDATLASLNRRGLARVIDVTTWGLPLALAFILHPQVVEWWSNQVGPISRWRLWHGEVMYALHHPAWERLFGLRTSLFTTIKHAFPLPLLRPLALIAITLFIGQMIWQCRSGQTLGKWLFGVKLVRSDLRRCSWGRSCLREALFFIDTLLLLSWVPGVVSILVTSKSQRIGDRVVDTIVVHAK